MSTSAAPQAVLHTSTEALLSFPPPSPPSPSAPAAFVNASSGLDEALAAAAATAAAALDDDLRLQLELECPSYTEEDMQMVDQLSFWVEGVVQTIFAILGIMGNIVASIILSRKEMRNAFNLLLVTMAIFDSTYLFGSILESFRKQFHLDTNLHIILFPYLLYPFHQIAITASIFMTVAIALERYIAVHYPLNYSQAMHEANALTKRIIKYVSCVTFLAVVFTATRFFEAQVVYVYHQKDNETGQVLDYSDYDVSLEPTPLRTAPIYTAYFNWSRLVVLGIIPFAMLVYLNTKIYQDIKARRARRLNNRYQHRKRLLKLPRLAFARRGAKGRSAEKRKMEEATKEVNNVSNGCSVAITLAPPPPGAASVGIGEDTAIISPSTAVTTAGDEMRPLAGAEAAEEAAYEDRAERDEHIELSIVVDEKARLQEEEERRRRGQPRAERDLPPVCEKKKSKLVLALRGKERRRQTNCSGGGGGGRGHRHNRGGRKGKRKDGSSSSTGGVAVNESRRKKEDNLAAIFMGFIVVFLVCHLPRLLLNIHELVTIRHAMLCQENGFYPFPLWSHLVISISHLLLCLNSATNILIYCVLSSKFREECRKVFRKI